MTDEREELVRQLTEVSNAFERSVRRSMPVEWPDVELTMPQLKTLASLLDGPQRMGDVASQSGISHSAATAMIDRLVDKSLVERSHDSQDRRVVVCALTTEGRELIERFWRVREESFRMLANNLSVDELRAVVSAMRIMHAAVSRNGCDQPE